jgi:hypothetical protein
MLAYCSCGHSRNAHFVYDRTPGCTLCQCDFFEGVTVPKLPPEHHVGPPGFTPCLRGDHNPSEPCAHEEIQRPGYHLTKIERGEIGEISKIKEEFAEFLDATTQGVAIMQLVELSDLFGAVETWLEKYHPNVTLNEVVKMKDVTRRAFKNGHRGRK